MLSSKEIFFKKISQSLKNLYFCCRNSEIFFDYFQIKTRSFSNSQYLENPWKEKKYGEEILRAIKKIPELMKLWKISPVKKKKNEFMKNKGQILKTQKNLKKTLKRNQKKKNYN